MLTEPLEIFEITDGESRELRFERGVYDQAFIRPSRAPGGIIEPALRVYVLPGTKEHYPPYWDITAKRLMAQLRPYMSRPDLKELTFKVTAHGVAPNKYFTLEVT